MIRRTYPEKALAHLVLKPGAETVTWTDDHGVRQVTVAEYHGKVLATWAKAWADDDDFYALVWDTDAQACQQIMYSTTRCYAPGVADVDATPDVIELAAQHYEAKWLEVLRANAERESKRLTETREVVFVESYNPRKVDRRPVKAGEIGVIDAIVQSQFSSPTDRVLVTMDDTKQVWVDASKLVINEPEQYMPSLASLQASARRNRTNFLGLHKPTALLAAVGGRVG